MDVVTLGETMLRFSSPLGETLESAPHLHADIGGSESNLAIMLARMGLRTGWVSRLPDNPLGQRVVGQIRHHGVDTARVIWAPGERMGTYYIEPGRTPRPTDVLYDRADSAFSRIEPDQVDWEYFHQAQWIHLTGITPALGAGPYRTIERTFYELVKGDCVISFDVNYRAKLWSTEQAAKTLEPLLSQATIIFCALRDAVNLFETPNSGSGAARALYQRFHPRIVVVTEGEAGGCAYDGADHRAAATRVDTLDPVGSGDAFAAGFILGYREEGVARGLQYGSALAALKRTYRGDLLWCGRRELQAVLENVPVGTPSRSSDVISR